LNGEEGNVAWIGTVGSLFIVGSAAAVVGRRYSDAAASRTAEGISVVGDPHQEVDEVDLAETDVVLLFEGSRGIPAVRDDDEPLNQEGKTMVGLNDIKLSDLPIGGSLHIGCHAILRIDERLDAGEFPSSGWRSNGPVPGAAILHARVEYDGEIVVGDGVKVVVQ
jgi:hypothetical protein